MSLARYTYEGVSESLSADAIGNAVYAAIMEVGFSDRQSQEQMENERERRFEKEVEAKQVKKENSVLGKYRKGFANGVETTMRRKTEQESKYKRVPDAVNDINNNGIDDDFEMNL